MVTYNLALTLIIAAVWRVSGEPQTISSPAINSTSSSSSSIISEDELTNNVTDAAVGSRISALMTHLPTLKNTVIVICVLTAALITCLVIKVVRLHVTVEAKREKRSGPVNVPTGNSNVDAIKSGRRIRKTRKYDIITTPAEHVEMAPLNEENDDEDDSTLFDVKYSSSLKHSHFLRGRHGVQFS